MTTEILDRLLTTLAVRIRAFAVCDIKAGWRLNFDAMDAVTIHYVLAGTGTVRVADAIDASFAPCNMIVIPASRSQSLGASGNVLGEADAANNCGLLADGLVKFTAGDGSQDTLLVCATITASYAGALGVFDHLRGPLVEDLSRSETLPLLFQMLVAEIARPGIGTQAIIESLMKHCLILLLRHHLLRLNVASPLFGVLEDHRLARAITAVLERPAATHTVESLAAVAGMSRSVFAERFARTFGETPIEFVQRVRIRLGAELLRSTELPIKTIAASVGYSSRSYFTRAFRNAHSIDPRSFRAQAARDEERAQLPRTPTLVDRAANAMAELFDEEGEDGR